MIFFASCEEKRRPTGKLEDDSECLGFFRDDMPRKFLITQHRHIGTLLAVIVAVAVAVSVAAAAVVASSEEEPSSLSIATGKIRSPDSQQYQVTMSPNACCDNVSCAGLGKESLTHSMADQPVTDHPFTRNVVAQFG